MMGSLKTLNWIVIIKYFRELHELVGLTAKYKLTRCLVVPQSILHEVDMHHHIVGIDVLVFE